MRRAAIALVLLAACGGRAATGPAWPRSAGRVVVEDWHDDGGESLDPGVQPAEVAALERSDDKNAAAPAAESPATEPSAPEGAGPPTDAPKTETIEIQFEEIEIKPDEIIEVN